MEMLHFDGIPYKTPIALQIDIFYKKNTNVGWLSETGTDAIGYLGGSSGS
jgi:hypothetical protein